MAEATIIGRTLAGKFRVIGVIGEGGMATVYRAVQDAEPKDVAIKVMNPELAKDSRFVRRFRREAKAAAMLKHPNTVAILEFGVDDGFVFLAMECVEGSDLALLLHRERRVSEARAAGIVKQVCGALGAAHELSIVHRDLKPDNIMIVKRSENAVGGAASPDSDFVKVLDFGIAKILDEDTDGKGPSDPRAEPVTAAKSLLTRVGTIVGTPAYMAPEQGRAEAVDGRTDVYACGVLLYELITGRVPFSGETPMQVVMRHVNEPPQPPSTFLPVHPALEAIIMRSLAKWPAERQQSAKELAAALTALLPELATEKRQVADSAGIKVIIGDVPKPPQPPQAPPQPPPPGASPPGPARPAAPAAVPAPPAAQKPVAASPVEVEQSTLVIEPTAPKAPAPAAPRPAAGSAAPSPHGGSAAQVRAVAAPPATTGAAPSFPTLNIDVPEDLLVGIDPKAGGAGALRHMHAAAKPAPEPIEPDTDSDDVRTLIAREPPDSAPIEVVVDSGDDDPRTVVAPPRGASIPDLSQPISFSGALPGGHDNGLPLALAADLPPTRPRDAPRAPPKPPPKRDADQPDKSTTLVSALPEDAPSGVKSSGPKPPGTTSLGTLKGTAKVDPVQVAVDVAAAATMVPNTKPSAVASAGVASTLALDATQRVDSSAVELEAAAARARLGIEPPSIEIGAAPQDPGTARSPTPEPGSSPAVEAGARSSGIIPAPVDVSALAPQVEPAPAPASAVVWEPKRRKLSGPVAMLLGILIGALLFGLALLAFKSGR